jgi:hypothetical protein
MNSADNRLKREKYASKSELVGNFFSKVGNRVFLNGLLNAKIVFTTLQRSVGTHNQDGGKFLLISVTSSEVSSISSTNLTGFVLFFIVG